MITEKKMFVNGEWHEGKTTYDLKSPYSGEVIAKIPISTKEDVLEAVDSAKKATAKMKALSALERSQILEKVARLFEEQLEECAQILTRENAKPLKAARGEIQRTIETYKFAAEEAKRLTGETIPMDAAKGGKGKFGYTVREPLGVIGAITPFNFPFNLVAHKLGPAFAAGNTVVLKPASQTPLSAIKTAKIFEEAGLPAGALHVVIGRGGEVGDLLVTHPDIKLITFTGSLEVGVDIKAKSGLKKVTLELGSNSSVIIDSVEDINDVAIRCVEGAFAYAGQVCISIQRIFVKKDLYEALTKAMIQKVRELKIGDPAEEETDISALIQEKEAVRAEEWIREAENAGANILCGGKRNGSIVEPTIIANVPAHVSINCKEAFAPLVLVNTYDKWEEAIERVNDSQYGLQAGVYTTSIHKAFEAVAQIEVGGVIVNDIPSFRVDQMPYGGVKNSGTGREGIKYATEEMTELKLAVFNL
ncbi:aldehyde dehydrogenase [Planococcus antarcticus DSM 14505]|uniref:Aldehyde dehydrogenase n=1 Tax=Planococcus antarcticus DSM 14505 TaxID=1185653 RepID=A0ABN4RL19_9BACL|nr:aldehyde dehydrogenase family protein [Planococcus antarcticus]ANU11201.1 aldehyde dehydrogenase [Planococcus antarcticus DSM 14505]